MATATTNEQSIEEAEAHLAKNVRTIDIFFLGITTVIGGQFISWNVGLEGGFWEYFCSVLLVAINYLSLNLCLAEMTSALPFSGGIFGFIRATSGPYLGFCVGCCETLQYVAYSANVAMVLAHAVVVSLGFGSLAEPLFAIFYFIVIATINIRGGAGFWRCNYILCSISIIILLVYIIATISGVNYDEYVASVDNTSKFHGFAMMKHFPSSMWLFLGSETLPLYGRSAANPRKAVPEASIACIITLFCTSLVVFFVTSTQYPGVYYIARSLLPFNYGFERAFGVSERVAIWLSLPAIVATGFGFTSAFGKQISSMARSKLLPDFYKTQTKHSQQPYRAIILGSFVAFIITVIAKAIYPPFQHDLFLLCCLASYFVYINTFIGFIIFRKHYSSISRHYVNPLGIPGAVIGILISTLGVISVLFFQGLNFVPIILFILYMGTLSGAYAWFIHKIQVFSADEQKALFTAYVINANVTGKKKRKNKKKHHVPSDAHSNATDSNKAVRSRSHDHTGLGEAKHQEQTGSTTHSLRPSNHTPYGSHSVSSRQGELDAVAERPDSDIEQSNSHQISSRADEDEGEGEGVVEGSGSEDDENSNSNSNVMNSTRVEYYDSMSHTPQYHHPHHPHPPLHTAATAIGAAVGLQHHAHPTAAVFRPKTPSSTRLQSNTHATIHHPSHSTPAAGAGATTAPTAPPKGIMSWFQPQLPIEHMMQQDDSISSEVRHKEAPHSHPASALPHGHHPHPVPSSTQQNSHSRPTTAERTATPSLSIPSSMGTYVRNLLTGTAAAIIPTNQPRNQQVVPVMSTTQSSKLGVWEEGEQQGEQGEGGESSQQPIFTIEKPYIPSHPHQHQSGALRASFADPATSTHIIATSISSTGRPYLSSQSDLIEETA